MGRRACAWSAHAANFFYVSLLLCLHFSRRGSLSAPVFVRIFKDSKHLEVWVEREKEGRFKLFKTYEICTFSGSLGPKLTEGDLQSPEGFYFVTPERMNPASRFHLSFNLGYPNTYDRAHGRTGSALMVHGSCVSIGCYAMTDAGIEEIYALTDAALRAGQPFFRVHVFPFALTDERLREQRGFRWREFWENLKEGYDYFEREGRPPNVRVRASRYVFD
jgi:murein L,D-transpeptidase YafK